MFEGLGVALVTPFDNKKNIDFPALERLIDHCIAGGTDYFVSLGSTGEKSSLSIQEQLSIIKHSHEYINGRVPLVVNVSSNSTSKMIDFSQKIETIKCEGYMSVCPYYNKPGQNGIFMHMKALSQVTEKPIILYNIPSRTGTMIHWETIINLAENCSNIVGIKEASGNFDHINNLILHKPKSFSLISGDDNLTLAFLALGSNGVISVMANAFPKVIKSLLSNFFNKNLKKSQELHISQIKFLSLVFKEGNPSGIKCVLQILGLCQNICRPPLTGLSISLYEEIKNEIKKINT